MTSTRLNLMPKNDVEVDQTTKMVGAKPETTTKYIENVSSLKFSSLPIIKDDTCIIKLKHFYYPEDTPIRKGNTRISKGDIHIFKDDTHIIKKNTHVSMEDTHISKKKHVFGRSRI